jgi:uncharacterized OB-fold protein
MSGRVIPDPSPTPETARFWEAAKEGTFLIRTCKRCGQAHWYPRAICPFCASDDTEWTEASGRGVIHSYSVMRRVAEPYAVAYVTLDEGPTIMTNIVDADFDAIFVGQPVELTFRLSENGFAVPMFRPRDGSTTGSPGSVVRSDEPSAK